MGAQVEIAGGPQTSLHSYQVKAVGAPLKLLRKTKKLLYNGLHCSPRGGPCSPKLLGMGGEGASDLSSYQVVEDMGAHTPNQP